MNIQFGQFTNDMQPDLVVFHHSEAFEWLQYLHANKVNWMTNDQAYQHIQDIYQFTYQLISLQHLQSFAVFFRGKE